MTNLVNEFFNRNLTEAEAQSLEELLGNSPEEAIRFGEKMKQEYLAMGLPIPTIPKDFGLSHQVLSLTKLALLATTLSPVILVWSLWPKKVLEISQTTTSSAPMEKVVVPAALSRPKTILPPPPLLVPQRLTGSSSEGTRLSVVVELDKPAPVAVCILDPKEQTVRTLYQGNLSPGKWSIHWDGLLSNGSQAPTGDYRIWVKSGTTEMSKNVSIETGK